jgi:hypothetical protein
LLMFSCRDTPFFADTWEKMPWWCFSGWLLCENAVSFAIFYGTVTSRSWLTCWKWTAMMTLRFRQQNRVDGDGSWWRFLVSFLVIFFVHSTGRCSNHVGVLAKTSFFIWFVVPFQELIYWQFRSNWRFRSISIARQPFRSFRSISSIYFDHFDLFQSFRFILIYFDSFLFRHRNRRNILMARQPFRSFHHVTAKMAHDGCCCHLTFASFTPIMLEYDISWLIWRLSDGKVENQH